MKGGELEVDVVDFREVIVGVAGIAQRLLAYWANCGL